MGVVGQLAVGADLAYGKIRHLRHSKRHRHHRQGPRRRHYRRVRRVTVISMEAKLVTTAEVARALGVSSRTLLRWVDRGFISPPERVNPSGHRRWNLERVRRQLAELDQS